MDLNLEVKNLSGGYGKTVIVRDISFRVETGDVLTILGPNGCGKSTLLKLLLNFLPKKSGEIYMTKSICSLLQTVLPLAARLTAHGREDKMDKDARGARGKIAPR